MLVQSGRGFPETLLSVTFHELGGGVRGSLSLCVYLSINVNTTNYRTPTTVGILMKAVYNYKFSVPFLKIKILFIEKLLIIYI